MLVNGLYPGPTIECFENDTIQVTVLNNLLSHATSIHWHGVHPIDTPWMDGAAWVTQAPIPAGKNFTYIFRAWPAGTHYWHAHMDAMQAARGLRGALIIQKQNDPFRQRYDEDKLLLLTDEWRDPDVCLKLEGAMPGNDVCSDMDYAGINGQVAPGDLQLKYDEAYPYPLVTVDAGKGCIHICAQA
jgi:FtsP/CotA-like multicopper oxidase with cupredoxin domain